MTEEQSTTEAQEYFDKEIKKDVDRSTIKLSEEKIESKLQGDLVIKDYPQLTEINLDNHKIRGLTIINCPKLKKLSINNNSMAILDIDKLNVKPEDDEPLDNDLVELYGNINDLEYLLLAHCVNIKQIFLSDNPYLKNIEGFDKILSLDYINLKGTSARFTFHTNEKLIRDYDDSQKDVDALIGWINTIRDAWEKKKLTLARTIRTKKQANKAIERLLKRTKESWNECLDSDNPMKTNMILGLSFRHPDRKERAQKILRWIDEAEDREGYEKLFAKWNKGEKEYNTDNDFYDGGLYMLSEYLRVEDPTPFYDKLKALEKEMSQPKNQ